MISEYIALRKTDLDSLCSRLVRTEPLESDLPEEDEKEQAAKRYLFDLNKEFDLDYQPFLERRNRNDWRLSQWNPNTSDAS
jgi:hypothetical protein